MALMGAPVHSRFDSLRSSLIGSLLCTSFAFVSLLAAHLLAPGLDIPINRDLSGFVTGFYPSEGGFVWTESVATIRLAGFNRRATWHCEIVFSSACPHPDQLPQVTISVGGRPLVRVRAANVVQRTVVTIPPDPGASGMVLTLTSSPTFVPGPHDTRVLGIAIRSIRFTCGDPLALPGRPLVLSLLTFSVGFGAFLGFVLRTRASIAVFTLLAGSGFAAVVSHAVARYYPPYLWKSALIGVSIASIVLVMAICLRRVWRTIGTMDRHAIALSATIAAVEIALLLHPYKPDMDDTMHVHRLQHVLAGNYYMTETAPGGFVSPRAVGFYLFAAPFSWMTTQTRSLLLVITALVFCIAAFAVHLAVKKATGDGTWAFYSCAAYLLTPVMMNMLGRGCFAHLFAYHLIIFAVLFIVYMRAGHALRYAILAGVTIAFSYLSHLATIMACFPLFILIAGVSWWKRPGGGRKFAAYLLAANLGAAGIAYLAYYGHFSDLYKAQIVKVYDSMFGKAEGPAQENYRPRESSELTPYAPGGRSILMRTMSVPRYALQAYGVPLLLLACAGLYFVFRSCRAGEIAGTIVCAWFAGSLGLIGLSVASPLDTRPYMIMAFAMAISAGRAVSYMVAGNLWLRIGVTLAALGQLYLAARASWVWLV